MLVAKTAAVCLLCSCGGEGSLDPTPELWTPRRQIWRLAQKSGGLKMFGSFFLYCATEPLGFMSQAPCCHDQKPLFLFFTTPEVPRESRTCGFGMTPKPCWDGPVSGG